MNSITWTIFSLVYYSNLPPPPPPNSPLPDGQHPGIQLWHPGISIQGATTAWHPIHSLTHSPLEASSESLTATEDMAKGEKGVVAVAVADQEQGQVVSTLQLDFGREWKTVPPSPC